MNATINLGKELAYYANRITNVFVTHDYMGDLISQYRDHVVNFYNPSDSNDFTKIYQYKKLISDKNFTPKPCDTPLSNIEDARDNLEHIIENKSAYKVILSILMKDCNGTNAAGSLIYDLLSVLKKSSKDFHETALKYDRHMGLSFSVADVINTVHSYGKLTGLVDYYNMEEGKDG